MPELPEDPRRQLVARGYDSTAETYARLRTVAWEQAPLERLLKMLPRPGHVLDLGCGNGEPIARQVLERGHRLTGVDLSAEQVRRARERYPLGQFIHADICDVALPEAEFDAAIAWDSLFHIPCELHAAVFHRVHGWLTPGAPFLLSLGGSEDEFIADHLGAPMFYSAHAPKMALGHLRDAGFEVLSSEIDDPSGRGHLAVFARKGV